MMSNKPLVSVLILTYDRTDLLKKCLDSVLKSDYPKLEIIVSDNGSRAKIADFIKPIYKDNKIKVVRLERNRGLTGGFNFGFKFCLGRYVVLLSNDTKINTDTISLLVEMAEEDHSIGIVSPQIVQMKNPKYLHNAGSFMTYTGFLYHYGILQKKVKKIYQKPYYIFSCNGAGFLIRKKAADFCGLYEDDFFYFYDDSDLSHRIWLAGYTVVYCPKAVLWHLWSGTMKGANPQIWYYSHRNHINSLIRNLSAPYLILLLINFNLLLMIWFFVNLINLRLNDCISLPRAYLWHLMNISENLKKRKHIQSKIRKITDSEIFKKTLVSPGWGYYLIHFNLKYNDKKLPSRVFYEQNL